MNHHLDQNQTNLSASPQEEASLHTTIRQLQQENAALQTQMQRLEKKYIRQKEYNANLQQNYDLIVQSGGHRLLEKYYHLRQFLRFSALKDKVSAVLSPLMQSFTRLKNRVLGHLTAEEMFQIIKNKKQFQILYTEETKALAETLHGILCNAGINSSLLTSHGTADASTPCIITDCKITVPTKGIYIVYLNTFPTATQPSLLESAYAILCSSQDVISALTAQNFPVSKLYYFPTENDCFQLRKDSLVSPVEYYTYRFLLANDCISFDVFYDRVGSYFQLQTDKLCLTLPETPDRKASFSQDNRYDFSFFPGLKHHIGWIGCGLSYKMIFRLASEQLQKNLLVCEDDVFFPADFSFRWEQITAYLNTHHDWDIFSGIMADMGNVSILDYTETDTEEFVYISKMMSMVFNIYTPKLYPILAEWNPLLRDKASNTIDRYLETKCSRVLTTCPFLVGHKEDLDSTIWNHKNAEYTPGIESSSKRLSLLIAAYLANRQ